jgi:PAS domain S-box-containing protein
MSKNFIRVLVVDDEQHTLAPLERSLENDIDHLLVDTVQSGDAGTGSHDAGRYDAVVTREETYHTDAGEVIDRVRDQTGGAVTTILLVSDRDRSPTETAGADVDTVFRIDPDSATQYPIVAAAIREQLREGTIDTSADDGPMQLPETLSESEEAILLIEGDVFVDCTEVAAQFLGYESCESIRGRHPAELSPPIQPDGQSSTRKVNDVIRVAHQGGYHRFNWVHRRADGRDVPVIVSLTPVLHEGKQVLYCVWREPPGSQTPGTQQPVEPEIADSVVSRRATTRVLVVGDDDDSGLAATIARSGTGITATAVPTSNEALLALDSRDDVDCVVLPSGLPESDAQHLIDRIHETDPTLPAVRVRRDGDADGLEDVREVVLGSTQEVEASLVETIRSAVDEAHTPGGRESGLQRYRTAFEVLPDPVAFFDHHEIAFTNEAFEATIDRDSGERSFIETTVHPGDRDRFRRVLEELETERDKQLRHVIRLREPDGTVRSYEVSGTTVAITGTDGVLVSFRDVTNRQRQQQQTAFEQALYRIILDQLVDARTRHELEAGVVEGLARRGYDLAWIGELDGTEFHPRAVRGDREFVATLDSALGGTRQPAEPFVRAARTGEPQYVGDLETLLSADWRDAAIERGYRSAFAVPLSYHGVSYGVLAVYAREPDPFDERARRLLARFADAVAFASHSLELENALATDAVTEATILVDDESYYLVELARTGAFADCEEFRVAGSVPRGDTAVIQYVAVRGSTPALRERLAAHPAVTDVSVIVETEPVRLQVTVTDPVPEGVLAGQGVVVTETVVDRDGATLSIELPAREALQSVASALESEYEGVSVRSSITRDREDRNWQGGCFQRADLTDKQLAALQAAYYNGYFERPRRATATEIAASLDVSHSTFLQHLHRAQEKLFESHFE